MALSCSPAAVNEIKLSLLNLKGTLHFLIPSPRPEIKFFAILPRYRLAGFKIIAIKICKKLNKPTQSVPFMRVFVEILFHLFSSLENERR